MYSKEKRGLNPSDVPHSASSKRTVGAVEYIERNYQPSDRLAIVVRNRLTGETTQRLASAEKIASPDFQAWLRHKNARGADIYISQNAYRADARTRSKGDVDKIRHVYLDLDKNGEDALTKIGDSLLVPEPSFVISTSPQKYQVIWKVADIAPNESETLQKAMVAEFGGDPAATDSSRVLRLPGFQNRSTSGTTQLKRTQGATRPIHCLISESQPIIGTPNRGPLMKRRATGVSPVK